MDNSRENNEDDLEWRDYVALIVAALQTVLLPFLVAIAIFFILLLVIK